MESNVVANSARSNFGLWGWLTIIFTFFSFMLSGHLILDSLNLTVPACAAYRGWNAGTLLAYSTPAGLIAIPCMLFIGWRINKAGAKRVVCACIVLATICSFLWGRVTELWQFFVITLVINAGVQGFGFLGMSTILDNWFPRKKGLALGWATIGFQASSVIMIPIETKLLNPNGQFAPENIVKVYDFLGFVLIALLILAIAIVKNNPEERNCAPDNDRSKSIEYYKGLHEEALEYKRTSPFTAKKLLQTKQMWLVGIVMGLVMLCLNCMMPTFIPSMQAGGMSVAKATAIYSTAAAIGAAFSYVYGVIDQKIGAKKATVFMCVHHALAAFITALAVMTGSAILLVIGALLIGSNMGSSSNLVGSLTGTIFGRYDFEKAYTAVYAVCCVVRQFAFLITGNVLNATGSYGIAYICAGVVAVLALIITLRIDDTCIGRVD
ncbi:MAG: MFS transporter [Mogibacterium sp.]|nr:MFS transporter [Mogibacterium sp.]